MIRYVKSFYRTWNDKLASELQDFFKLDGNKKIKQLSKGMHAKLSLLLAVSHEPELLILDGAEHSAFGERALVGERGDRNPNHHRAILATSTAFWDAYLGNDDGSREWLLGDGPRSVLEDADVWQAARAEE